MLRWNQRLKVAAVVVALMVPGLAAADLMESDHFRLDPNVTSNFGGAGSSASYKLTDAGGEAVVSNGASSSYRLTQGYVSQLAHSLSLSVLPSGVVAYYPLDSGAGTQAYDVSTNENRGVLNNTPTWTSGRVGGALALNGSTQYVDIPSSSSLSQTGDLTIEAWVNLTDHAGHNTIIAKVTGDGTTASTYELRTEQTTGRLQFRAFDTALRTITSAGAVATGGWHHVAVTKTGGTAKLFIDGSQDGQGSVGTTSNVANAAKLGARDNLAAGSFFKGTLDEVRLFGRALSPAEIAGDHTAGLAGLEFAHTLPNVTPGSSSTYSADAVVRTDAGGYDLYIQSPGLLTHTDGATTIPALIATIASPIAWVEGTTKGLGFTVTAGTQIEPQWNAGANYAGVPAAASVFHSRTGLTGGVPEKTTLQFRADTAPSQKQGTYSTTIIYTATLKP